MSPLPQANTFQEFTAYVGIIGAFFAVAFFIYVFRKYCCGLPAADAHEMRRPLPGAAAPYSGPGPERGTDPGFAIGTHFIRAAPQNWRATFGSHKMTEGDLASLTGGASSSTDALHVGDFAAWVAAPVTVGEIIVWNDDDTASAPVSSASATPPVATERALPVAWPAAPTSSPDAPVAEACV